jgi:hypothetical protein
MDDDELQQLPPPPNDKRSLSAQDRVDLIKSAKQRTPQEFKRLDNYVAEKATRYPLRSARFRTELKFWLKQAEKDGVEWE